MHAQAKESYLKAHRKITRTGQKIMSIDVDAGMWGEVRGKFSSDCSDFPVKWDQGHQLQGPERRHQGCGKRMGGLKDVHGRTRD